MEYLIGDVQGCCDALDHLLDVIGFSPSRDRLYVLGDMVNRGPQSLETLERLMGLGDSAICLLGNHDLHMLAVAAGVRLAHDTDTLDDILASPRREALIEWVRHRPLALQTQGWLMVHAGVVPQWSAEQTLVLAQEVATVLRGRDLHDFLQTMYGNEPDCWSKSLQGPDRWRFVINTLTRIRFCGMDGRLEFKTKGNAATPPPGYMAWFDVPGRRTAGTPVAFGHWSALGLLSRRDILAIDTGCVWGGSLTAVRIDGARREIVQVKCDQAAMA